MSFVLIPNQALRYLAVNVHGVDCVATGCHSRELSMGLIVLLRVDCVATFVGTHGSPQLACPGRYIA